MQAGVSDAVSASKRISTLRASTRRASAAAVSANPSMKLFDESKVAVVAEVAEAAGVAVVAVVAEAAGVAVVTAVTMKRLGNSP